MRESATASHITLAAAYDGFPLWRNNVGVLVDQTGRPVRYGLCNESPAMNKRVKSSDYIGIRSLLITEEWVGHVVGVFTAVETKASNWVFNPKDQHAIAQANFHDIVTRAGGFAGFARNVDDYKRIVRL